MQLKRQETCHDCGVKIGRLHKVGCDAPQCTQCGEQLLQCRHWKTGNSTWTGIMYPDEHLIAELMQIFVKWGGVNGWVKCEPNDKEARHDLNQAVIIKRRIFYQLFENK